MMNELPIHIAETGEMYEDKSGWAKRVRLDRASKTVEIEIDGQHLNVHDSYLPWLMLALETVRDRAR